MDKLFLFSICGIIFVGVVTLFGAMSVDPATKHKYLLEKQGYQNINVEPYEMWGCGNDDSYFNSSEFSADALNGERVHGYVCCGLFLKGCTVRIEL